MATANASHNAADNTGQAASAAAAVEPTLTPLQRLARSRERLRHVLAPPPRPADDSSSGGTGKSWEQRLREIPGLATVLDVVNVWWQQHPLHAVSIVAGEVGRTTLRPIANRHPFMLVSVALLAGVVLAWARPWRWALRSALFAGLAPQVASRVVSSLPIESWLTMLGTLFTSTHAGRQSADAGAATGATDGGPRSSDSGMGTEAAPAAAPQN